MRREQGTGRRTRAHVRRWRCAVVGAAALLLPCIAHGQNAGAAARTDSIVFARAQALVSGGEGKEGRAVVDSALGRIPPGGPRYAEGLFWRATLASNALDAERDYRRIAVEYVLSPRVPVALTRLAQLELARGDRALARQHLERLLHEYPPQAERANAWYWLGRIAFESGDAGRGCAALDRARMLATQTDIELANQIAGESRRCAAGANTTAAGSPNVPGRNSRAEAAVANPQPAGRAVSRPASRGTKRSTDGGRLTIQVGAYPSRTSAESARQRLTAHGFPARVVPAGRYYRVRVGRYPTRTAAAAMVKKLKAAHNDAIIVDAEQLP